MKPGDPIEVYRDGQLVADGTIIARETWFDIEHHGYVLRVQQCALWFWEDELRMPGRR
jgi:hypothetical protein